MSLDVSHTQAHQLCHSLCAHTARISLLLMVISFSFPLNVTSDVFLFIDHTCTENTHTDASKNSHILKHKVPHCAYSSYFGHILAQCPLFSSHHFTLLPLQRGQCLQIDRNILSAVFHQLYFKAPSEATLTFLFGCGCFSWWNAISDWFHWDSSVYW